MRRGEKTFRARLGQSVIELILALPFLLLLVAVLFFFTRRSAEEGDQLLRARVETFAIAHSGKTWPGPHPPNIDLKMPQWNPDRYLTRMGAAGSIDWGDILKSVGMAFITSFGADYLQEILKVPMHWYTTFGFYGGMTYLVSGGDTRAAVVGGAAAALGTQEAGGAINKTFGLTAGSTASHVVQGAIVGGAQGLGSGDFKEMLQGATGGALSSWIASAPFQEGVKDVAGGSSFLAGAITGAVSSTGQMIISGDLSLQRFLVASAASGASSAIYSKVDNAIVAGTLNGLSYAAIEMLATGKFDAERAGAATAAGLISGVVVEGLAAYQKKHPPKSALPESASAASDKEKAQSKLAATIASDHFQTAMSNFLAASVTSSVMKGLSSLNRGGLLQGIIIPGDNRSFFETLNQNQRMVEALNRRSWGALPTSLNTPLTPTQAQALLRANRPQIKKNLERVMSSALASELRGPGRGEAPAAPPRSRQLADPEGKNAAFVNTAEAGAASPASAEDPVAKALAEQIIHSQEVQAALEDFLDEATDGNIATALEHLQQQRQQMLALEIMKRDWEARKNQSFAPAPHS